MDFELKEIGITIMIGAFTLLGLNLILNRLLTVNIIGPILDKLSLVKVNNKEASDSSFSSMRLAFFIGLSFGIGILSEDLSYKFVDNELPFGFQSKIDSRITFLVGSIEVEPDLNILATDLANNDAFVIAATRGEHIGIEDAVVVPQKPGEPQILGKSPNTFAYPLKPELFNKVGTERQKPSKTPQADAILTQSWILNSERNTNPCETPPKSFMKQIFEVFWKAPKEDCFVKNAIERLYYFAKNTVYEHKNYYDEMGKIQSRSDYARSIGFISLFYLAIAFLLIIILTVDRSTLRNRLIIFLRFRYKKTFSPKLRPIKFSRPATTVLLLVTLIFLSWWAYKREIMEFNKRAYGYFNTMMTKQKLSKIDNGMPISNWK